MIKDESYNCRICGDEMTWCSSDYPKGYKHSGVCGYCSGDIELGDVIRDAWDWGGLFGIIEQLWFRLKYKLNKNGK